MPYAAGVYTLPPGTAATTLTPIDSSDYNAFIADIEAAQNAARPVVAGGTGAVTAALARVALGLEIGVNVQAYSADLSDLVTQWTPASAAGPASLIFLEDTDNGANKITLIAPSSIASDKTVTFQDITGTLYVTGGTDVAIADGGTGASTADAAVTSLALASYFPGMLYGLTLSNNGSDATNDIDIAVGVANDSTNVRVMKLTGALTKRLDAAWAVGTGNGGLDTGAIANTTYHMWLIIRSDTGVVDVLFSTSASAPTMPTNYDYKRRIGSIVRSGGAIKTFVQTNDVFMLGTPVLDVDAANPGGTAQTRTLSVPLGIKVSAIVGHTLIDTGSGVTQAALLSDLAQPDVAPSTSMWDVLIVSVGTTDMVNTIEKEVVTNTSAQIRSRMSGSSASHTEEIFTFGWRDNRGRLG